MAPRSATTGNAHELYEELRACQRRLGTAAECHDDFERVLHLAHQINNQITAEYLRAAAASAAAPTLASVCRNWLRSGR